MSFVYSRNVLILFFGTLLAAKVCWAACLKEQPVENFTAEFEILKTTTPQISCLFDEQGKVLKNQPLMIDKEGCILRLYVMKVKEGKLPKQVDWEKNKFSVYHNGPLCKMKAGSHFTRELASSGKECCLEMENARQNGKQLYCKTAPKVEPIAEITETYVRCSQKGVSWKFVE